MQIKEKKDIKLVSAIMHDSEFCDKDFAFDSIENKFVLNARYVTMQGGRFLKTRSPIQKDICFHLEFWNVTKYDAINLDRILEGRGMGGVFNYIKIRDRGRKLTLVSQDLRIVLELSEIRGTFDVEGRDGEQMRRTLEKLWKRQTGHR